VTHDQVEAMSMCDRIAIMNAGEIVQIATPGEMYRDPRTEFVAGFLGNPPIAFLRGVAARGGFALANSDVVLPLPASVTLPAPGRTLTLGIRPENFGPTGDLPIRGRISFVEAQGRENLYDLTLPNGNVLRSIQPVRGDLTLNDDVEWLVASDRILVFDETGVRL
jgi:inositol-phosphate transport system ATP-binding protein